jgi:hypothetical protein
MTAGLFALLSRAWEIGSGTERTIVGSTLLLHSVHQM